jgi:hypothetical protein
VIVGVAASSNARADEPKPLRAEDIKLDAQAAPPSLLPEAPPEAPPPPPHKKGIVLESAMGVLGFGGQFKHVAPPGLFLHVQGGYEFFDWLMLFGYGDLAFTDTSEAVDPTKVRAFPIFGFGVGPRITIHATPRFAVYAQGSLGAMKADVPAKALAILGFKNAESLGLDLGGRLGIEWYQVDRHLALGLAGGVRDATGFAKQIGGSDLPLMWDASLAIRYTF